METKKFENLKRLNLIAAVFHLVQGILILVLSSDFAVTITRNYLKFDQASRSLVTVTENLFDVRLAYLIALFPLLTAVAHFMVATVLYDRYVENLSRGINPYRWAEYSVTSSIMIVIIALLVGISDIGTLLLIFSINATMIFFGYLMELLNQYTEKVRWSPFIFGSFAGLIPWVVIFMVILRSSPPDFVIWIFISIAIFFNLFPVNMILQYKKIGKWADYLYGEKVYILLSLTSKSILVWQVYAGTLQP
ncbi:heliorhodopsin HeR [Thermococcus zilligii]|uniref:heliorhodopsin HeR n=1 Tax=Thermococcus zilligii TaxID=54076 RepID=UPI0004956DB5|nr:heliorhodopsin HeR [Thermococcus zilligii]